MLKRHGTVRFKCTLLRVIKEVNIERSIRFVRVSDWRRLDPGLDPGAQYIRKPNSIA